MKLIDLYENTKKNPFAKMTDDELIAIVNRDPHNLKDILGVWDTPKNTYTTVYSPIPSDRVLIAACTQASTHPLVYVLKAKIKPSIKLQEETCRVEGSIAMGYLLDYGIIPDNHIITIACKSDGQALHWLTQYNIPVSDEIVRIAIDQLIKHYADWYLEDLLKLPNLHPLPLDTQQQVMSYDMTLALKYLDKFPYIHQLVDNLRSTLESKTYSLATVHKLIDVVYQDDEDMAATLKHRANAIQRKLDERDKHK